jgi:hypothetical protein
VETSAIYAQLVDGIARSFLFQYGWKADLGRQRGQAQLGEILLLAPQHDPGAPIHHGLQELEVLLGHGDVVAVRRGRPAGTSSS